MKFKFNKENIIVSAILGLFLVSILLSLTNSATESQQSEGIISGKSGIGLLQIYGPLSIGSTNQLFQPTGVDALISQIQDFQKDKRIKALVIRINSPGGTVGSSQELFNEIIKFKEVTKKPVVISIADVGASGAYWTALAGDRIFANPGSMVGNIGVIMQGIDISEIADKYGITFNVFKSGEYKDLLSSYRKTTQRETKLLNDLIQNVHSQFVTTLQKSRNLSQKKAAELADGRIYTGEQALEVGLIDELGGLKEAISYTSKKVGLSSDPELYYKNKPNIQQFMNFWKTEFFKGIFSDLFASNNKLYL